MIRLSANQHRTDETVFGPEGLRTVFSGEHAWCGEKMLLSSELEDAMPIRDFFESGTFATGLDTYAQTNGVDRRAVASYWSLYYFSALSIPYIVARRAALALPVSIDEMTIALADDGLPRAFGLPHTGDWCEHGAPLDLVRPLVSAHLGQAVAELKRHGGVAPKLGWNNAAVYIDYAINATEPGANAGAGPAAAGAEDAATETDHWTARSLFEEKTFADGSPNPFHGSLRHELAGGQVQCRRKVCCLRYLLPGIPSCGELCALPAQREAHGHSDDDSHSHSDGHQGNH